MYKIAPNELEEPRAFLAQSPSEFSPRVLPSGFAQEIYHGILNKLFFPIVLASIESRAN